MARKPSQPAAEAVAGNDEDMLIVTVSRVAKAANVTFRPGREYAVKRKVLAELGDALATQEPAPAS